MSLFSKLFSRDDKVSEESAGESAKAKTSDTRPDAGKGSAASAGSTAEKAAAQAAATEKNAVKTTPKGQAGQGSAAEGQGTGAAKDGAAGAKPPPLEAAAGKGKKAGNKTLAYGRTDKGSPVQPPAAAPAPAGTNKGTPPKPMPAPGAQAGGSAAQPAGAAAQPAPAAHGGGAAQAGSAAQPGSTVQVGNAVQVGAATQAGSAAQGPAPAAAGTAQAGAATGGTQGAGAGHAGSQAGAAKTGGSGVYGGVTAQAGAAAHGGAAGAATQTGAMPGGSGVYGAAAAQAGAGAPAAIPPLPDTQRDSADAIDAALDALESKSQARNSSPGHAGDEAALAETFAAVAQVHAQPLRELMFQLELGRTPREWCTLARPVLRPLLEAAQQIGMLELVGALLAFDAALERAAGETTATLSERSSETLKTVYQGLCRLLPSVFTVTSESGGPGRQTVLLESLLLQIPELHRRSLAKLYAAGLSSLAQLSQARADELVAVTGLEEPLAERLIAHVRNFEDARTRVLPTEQKSRAHERLRSVVERLRQLQAEFERAEREEQSDQKRAARRGREAALHELDLVLAEIGEVTVIEELKRCPVQLKIQRVSTYLKEAQASV